jgi:hypothetical protein
VHPFYLAHKEDSVHDAIIKQFIRFTDTPEGRGIIRVGGTVPCLEGRNLMKKKPQESRQAQANDGLR